MEIQHERTRFETDTPALHPVPEASFSATTLHRDNSFILSGYRDVSYSYWQCLQSTLELHNETVNIWSHALGSLWFLHQFFDDCIKDDTTALLTSDRFAIGMFDMSVALCFFFSAAFHTFSNHSRSVYRLSNQMDHLGIVLLMWGTGLSGAHFVFRCQRTAYTVHLTLMSASAVLSGLATLRPAFRETGDQQPRVLVYTCFGIGLFAPVLHGLYAFGLAELDERMGLRSFLGLALLNSIGASLYLYKAPERWLPGRCDLAGQGHNWMHGFVLAGVWMRCNGLVQLAIPRSARQEVL
ncbi:hemeolysin-III family protein [Verticillium dahliae VdLs.17]|uniref:Hemeolysin-III family protein n=1 Tax=Verticillium dahliae (strain VdLs.17 / ATCC MYA-4575 / FGSC 10137) TaxID=498257 RepID=G2X526_VERDV|nr:hemeolysin-III family protein [Verticillium dahliae VdLs.17]EGY23820.1 hemeolysin-III family protein [Verticillium dahliae VdLs.17]